MSSGISLEASRIEQRLKTLSKRVSRTFSDSTGLFPHIRIPGQALATERPASVKCGSRRRLQMAAITFGDRRVALEFNRHKF
jgi:ABC-type uncharacterized transport system YnjBCD ATPase subunit